MNTPRIHAALIKLWADGAKIEVYGNDWGWEPAKDPQWLPEVLYRVKPVPMVQWLVATPTGAVYAYAATIVEARAWHHAGQVERRIMRLEIDPTTFTATCVLEDV